VNNTEINMWIQVHNLQAYADAHGFGPSWRQLCSDRDQRAANLVILETWKHDDIACRTIAYSILEYLKANTHVDRATRVAQSILGANKL
jgi:hypothetical protein